MIVECFVLSILIGFIRKGGLRDLSRIPLRHSYLFILGFALFAGAYLMFHLTGDQMLVPYVRAANVLQYVVLLIAIGLNLRPHGMRLVGLGTLLNAAAITANGGVMPVSERALRIAGLADMLDPEKTAQFVRHAVITPETHLKAIADIIPVPGFAIIMPQVVSIGDVLIAVGVFVLIQRYMCGREGR